MVEQQKTHAEELAGALAEAMVLAANEGREVDRLRAAILAHKRAMSEYRGAEFDLALWSVLEGASNAA